MNQNIVMDVSSSRIGKFKLFSLDDVNYSEKIVVLAHYFLLKIRNKISRELTMILGVRFVTKKKIQHGMICLGYMGSSQCSRRVAIV